MRLKKFLWQLQRIVCVNRLQRSGVNRLVLGLMILSKEKGGVSTYFFSKQPESCSASHTDTRQWAPGVGKTLTAEALSEHFKRPLYSVRSLF
jgi:hypothetical protein